MKRLAIMLFVPLLGWPCLLHAQATRALPRTGTYGVSFALPEGGGAGLGFRKMVSERRSAGLEVQLGARWLEVESAQGQDESRTSFSVGLSPDVRMYRRADGPVIPFIEWMGRVSYQNAAGDAWAADGALGVGLGVEWLPLPAMSVSGSTGFALTVQRQSGGGTSAKSVMFDAFRSELSLNLYF